MKIMGHAAKPTECYKTYRARKKAIIEEEE